MFDSRNPEIGLSRDYLSSGESHDDDIAYEVTCRALADGWTDDDRHVLPDDLESIPPGHFLSVIVGSVNRNRLNGHDAVRLMKAEARLTASHEAGKLATMVEVALSPPGDPGSPVERSTEAIDYAACEIAAALSLTRRAAEKQMNEALTLTDRLRRVHESFTAGDLDLPKIRDLITALGHLDNETIDFVLDRCLFDAPGLTRGQLRARVARLVMEFDPEGSKAAMAEGLADRRVVTRPNPDQTASVAIESVDPTRAHAAGRHIDRLARWYRRQGDPRTLDQLRADIAVDLLSGRCRCGKGGNTEGRVHVTAELETLARLANNPGELDGYGPVIAEIARKAVDEAAEGEWTYQVTDNGRPLATGTVKRRPTRAQRRYLHALYPTCVFPGCRMPAQQCDLDHRRPHSRGGATSNHNLEPLCRYHHMMRHHTPWQLTRHVDDEHTWTSPLGHTYLAKRGPPH